MHLCCLSKCCSIKQREEGAYIRGAAFEKFSTIGGSLILGEALIEDLLKEISKTSIF